MCAFTVHAAVMAINEVLEKEDSDETLKALQNPAACLVDVQSENASHYQVTLLTAKKEKTSKAGAQVSSLYTLCAGQCMSPNIDLLMCTCTRPHIAGVKATFLEYAVCT